MADGTIDFMLATHKAAVKKGTATADTFDALHAAREFDFLHTYGGEAYMEWLWDEDDKNEPPVFDPPWVDTPEVGGEFA
ncbi:hypothetical protein K8R03_02960 [Candidatus Kaiserbacteria bacterium]|nr:hypothetical protein [Candidatus Kaiserbacteria bacterium]